MYKSGGVFGDFLDFCPPIFRVEISGDFGRNFGGLKGDFSIPRFRVV